MAITTRPRQLCHSLPVRDLERSVEFFTALGFQFNPQFGDESAAYMIINELASVMLIVEARWKTFTTKQICDTRTAAEISLGLSAVSREEVDALVQAAVAAGATQTGDMEDHGFMYVGSFDDLDLHHWEIVYTQPSAAAPQ